MGQSWSGTRNVYGLTQYEVDELVGLSKGCCASLLGMFVVHV